jgi:predicted amidohydrolase YtcJ
MLRVLPLFLAGSLFAQAPDAVFVHGRVVTLDAGERVVEALAVREGRLLAVGSDAEIEKLAGPQTEVIDLKGRMVLPGLIETHCHSIGAARSALAADYRELYSIPQIQDWVRRRAAELPEGTWIEVPRNEITRLFERRFPTPEELDAATTRHPVLFVSVTKSVLNSAGWRALGVTREGDTVSGGDVVFENGRPVLMRGGQAALRTLMPQPPAPSPADLRAKLRELHSVYNSVGFTSIFERATDRAGFDLFRDLAARGELTTRVRGTFRFSAKDAAGVETYVRSLGLQAGEGDDWVRATCLKITVDGGIHWGTTWLSEPHGEKRTAFYRNTDPAYTGTQSYTEPQMREIFGAANRLGWPISAHVTGDGGAMAVLRAVEAVAAEQPSMRDRRFNLIHCYFPDAAMVALAKKVNAGVDTQGYLYYRDADFIAKIYGPAWAERFIGLGDWVRGGVPVGLNSDHMIGFDPDHAMNSFNPFLMLWLAVARQDDQGRVHGAHQRLGRLDALRTLTTWAASLSFDEDRLGSLEAGKLADFVVLDRDYLTCPEAEIRQIRALRTVIGGRTVWQR